MKPLKRLLELLIFLFCLHTLPAQSTSQLEKSLADLDGQLRADPKQAEAYHRRGLVHFKLGHFKESIGDFDKCIELEPQRKAGHWQRGISYYYAGQFDEGRKQFEGYQEFDSNDVENAVWRYLCMAQALGIPKARADMLKIGTDKRVPMRQVYEMFLGKLKPEEVLEAAQAGNPNKELLNRQFFYAHLYVGIHYDLAGDANQALHHLNKAANEYRIDHYMGDVARIHRDLLKDRLKRNGGILPP
jgi:lipoprotein NlpI